MGGDTERRFTVQTRYPAIYPRVVGRVRLPYGDRDLEMIEILALATNIDTVHTFIIENGIFEKLDRLAKIKLDPSLATLRAT